MIVTSVLGPQSFQINVNLFPVITKRLLNADEVKSAVENIRGSVIGPGHWAKDIFYFMLGKKLFGHAYQLTNNPLFI